MIHTVILAIHQKIYIFIWREICKKNMVSFCCNPDSIYILHLHSQLCIKGPEQCVNLISQQLDQQDKGPWGCYPHMYNVKCEQIFYILSLTNSQSLAQPTLIIQLFGVLHDTRFVHSIFKSDNVPFPFFFAVSEFNI